MKSSLEKIISSDKGRINTCKPFSLKKEIAKFIVKSKYSVVKQDFDYLNLGCGNQLYEGFLNADITVNKNLVFKNKKNFLYLDATKPWGIKENYFKGIYTEHMLEHLTYTQGIFALSEAFRTLKKDGIIRVIVPSLDKYLDFESIEDEQFFKDKFHFRALAISNLTQNAEHVSTWDFELLKYALENIGFQNVKQEEFKAGRDFNLLKDTVARRWASIYVEGKK